MAESAHFTLLFGPTSVSIHNDGDVAGKALEIYFFFG
jgi:hypothetical protein